MRRAQGSHPRLVFVDGRCRDDGGTGDGRPVRGILERETATTVTVVEGLDGTIEQVQQGVDAVVCDHGDAVDGIAVLEAVRDRDPSVPVVLVGPDDGRFASRAVGADVSEYVPRSESDLPAAVVERVRAAMDATPPVRADGAERLPIEERSPDVRRRLKERAMEEAPVGITISDASQPDNPLIYVNDAFVELTGYSKAETVGRNCRFLQGERSAPAAVAAMREAIEAEEPVSVELVNYRKDGETFWNEVDIAPVRNADGDVTNYVGFQTDVTARKEAEFELKRERQRLDHLLNRISGLLGDVHGDLIQAVSREEVERAVCDRLAATAGYAGCWIGTRDLARDAVDPTASAGAVPEATDRVGVDLADPGPDGRPIARAVETRSVQVVDDPDEVAAVAAAVEWPGTEPPGAVAAIPLVYQETLYGVLTVYATGDDALNDREMVVLEALGRAAATAINALERGRIIASDDVTELEFEIRDPSLFLVSLAADHDAAVEYEGSLSGEDGSIRAFFSTDAQPSAVRSCLEAHADVAALTILHGREDGTLFECLLDADSLVAALAERGVRTRSLTAADGAGHLTVELPAETDARAIVALLEDRYDRTELVAYRERERPPETKRAFIEELRADLTERQLTALQSAYVSGYFESNRPVSGDELAESMGVTRSTFHQHLRAAERKLVGAIFDD